MSHTSHWAILSRSIPAVPIDPLSQRELQPHVLPAGTRINAALVVLAKAAKSGVDKVDVEARTEPGWVSIQRVGVADLREAIQ